MSHPKPEDGTKSRKAGKRSKEGGRPRFWPVNPLIGFRVLHIEHFGFTMDTRLHHTAGQLDTPSCSIPVVRGANPKWLDMEELANSNATIGITRPPKCFLDD